MSLEPSYFEGYKAEVDTKVQSIRDTHEAVLELHGLVGTNSVAGGYQKGASEERAAANLWRKIAMGGLLAAAVWIFIKYWAGFGSSGQVNWGDLATAASLTLVLLATAGYASRQSKLHREAEQEMRWFALEVKAIDPFISSLPSEQQIELKKKLSEKLFGQDRTVGESPDSAVDAQAFKTIVDSLMSNIQSILKVAGK